MPELLRANIAHQVRGTIRVPVYMAIKACDAPAWKLAAAVLGLIELLLGEWSDKQSETLELLWVQDSIKQLIVVHYGDDPSLRYIPKVRPGRQIDGRRKPG